MKTTLKCLLSPWRGAAVGAALLLSGLPNVCQAQPSPVGTWDCVLSGGGQPGVAYLTFTTNLDASGNFTFYGYAVVAGLPPSSSVSERTPLGDVGRGGTTTSTNSTGSTNIFGFVPLSGPWGYDSQGRVIGNFAELINVGSTSTNSSELCVNITNYNYVITNSSGSVNSLATTNFSECFSNLPSLLVFSWQALSSGGTTNNYHTSVTATGNSNLVVNFPYVLTNSSGAAEGTGIASFSFAVTSLPFITNFVATNYASDNTANVASNGFGLIPSVSVGPSSAEMTNQVSFVGKVVPGQRLTLNSSTTYGKATYRGVPAVSLPNLSGTRWNGLKKQQGVSYVEFFSLQSFASGNPFIDIEDNITNFPNIYYSTNGVGPGYTLSTIVIVSKQKKAGFTALEFYGTNSVLRATYGGFSSNAKTTTSNSKGVIEPNININYKAQKQ